MYLAEERICHLKQEPMTCREIWIKLGGGNKRGWQFSSKPSLLSRGKVRGEDLELTGEVIGTGSWADVGVVNCLKVAAKSLHHRLVYDYYHKLFQCEMAVAA